MRRLHRAGWPAARGGCALRGDQQLYPASAQPRRLPCRDGRAPRRCGWRAPSGPAGHGRLSRQPVRLLHARHRHGAGCTLAGAAEAVGSRGPAGAPGQSLPLHRLCADPARGGGGRRLRPARRRRAGAEPRGGCRASGGNGGRKPGRTGTRQRCRSGRRGRSGRRAGSGAGGHHSCRRDRCRRVDQQGSAGYCAGGVHRPSGRTRPDCREGRGNRDRGDGVLFGCGGCPDGGRAGPRGLLEPHRRLADTQYGDGRRQHRQRLAHRRPSAGADRAWGRAGPAKRREAARHAA